MKAVVAAFNQEKALVGAFAVIVQLHRLIVYTAQLRTDRGQPWQPGRDVRINNVVTGLDKSC